LLAPAVPVFAFILLLAARAGAGAIVLGQAGLALDESAVRARVEGYCTTILGDPTQRGGVLECGYRPPLQQVADDDPRALVVVVFVRLELRASLLGIVGVQTPGASGEGRARPYEGVDDLDVDGEVPDVDVGVPVPLEPP